MLKGFEMKSNLTIRERARATKRATKRMRVEKPSREPLEAPRYAEISTTTILPDGSADGAHEQIHFRTRTRPTNF